jgi:hypothetical protein
LLGRRVLPEADPEGLERSGLLDRSGLRDHRLVYLEGAVKLGKIGGGRRLPKQENFLGRGEGRPDESGVQGVGDGATLLQDPDDGDKPMQGVTPVGS